MSDTFALALRCFGTGHLSEAERLCRDTVARDPGHAPCFHLLGLVCFQSGRTTEAIANIGRALALNDTIAEAHNNLGHILTVAGRPAEALTALERALALVPNYADARNNLGNLHKSQGRLEDAVACYERGLLIQPNHVEALVNLATLRLEQSEAEAAIGHLRLALALRPDAVTIRAILATALGVQGCHEEAVGEFERALASKPDDLELRMAQGVALSRCGRLEEARRHFEHCRDHDAEDTHGARIQLARLGQGPLPTRASDAFLARLYAGRSRPGALNCRGAELVARMLKRIWSGEPSVILDAGCGTGRVGRLIHGMAARLDGVDLSPELLEVARAGGYYTDLAQQDLVACIAGRPNTYDVITCADTLLHFGDLEPVFLAMAGALKKGGWFVFTVFPNDRESDDHKVRVDDFDTLVPEGRFVHGESYLKDMAETNGFQIEQWKQDVHTYRPGLTRSVLVIALSRRTYQRL